MGFGSFSGRDEDANAAAEYAKEQKRRALGLGNQNQMAGAPGGPGMGAPSAMGGAPGGPNMGAPSMLAGAPAKYSGPMDDIANPGARLAVPPPGPDGQIQDRWAAERLDPNWQQANRVTPEMAAMGNVGASNPIHFPGQDGGNRPPPLPVDRPANPLAKPQNPEGATPPGVGPSAALGAARGLAGGGGLGGAATGALAAVSPIAAVGMQYLQGQGEKNRMRQEARAKLLSQNAASLGYPTQGAYAAGVNRDINDVEGTDYLTEFMKRRQGHQGRG